MRSVIAAFGVALVALVVAAPAQALTTVNVRIEGKEETLFEGRVATEPHGVRASSDKIAGGKLRKCNGIDVNDPSNTVPGVTPTAVSADAMTLIGETFDGQWYKQYEDYFITRWGPDLQDVAANGYWGILVNNVFTNVGGCQYQLGDGDEILWVYNAFKNRPTLALFPEAAHYEAGERPLVINGVPAGTKVPVEVVSYADAAEDVPPEVPNRVGTAGLEGAAVASVLTNGKGFERVQTSGAEVFVSGPDGKTSVEFARPGWHRIKATVGAPGLESVIRSNRLDICVTGGSGEPSAVEGVSSCDRTPPADQVRVAGQTVGEVEEEPEEAAKPAPKPGGGAQTPPAGPVRVSLPKVNRGQIANGAVVVSWKVLSAGAGIKKWTISSLAVGQKHARWVTRASGATKTKATIRLPQGHSFKLRFAITDKVGETSTVSLGEVKVPEARPGHRDHN
jgi:hypothetical protein